MSRLCRPRSYKMEIGCFLISKNELCKNLYVSNLLKTFHDNLLRNATSRWEQKSGHIGTNDFSFKQKKQRPFARLCCPWSTCLVHPGGLRERSVICIAVPEGLVRSSKSDNRIVPSLSISCQTTFGWVGRRGDGRISKIRVAPLECARRGERSGLRYNISTEGKSWVSIQLPRHSEMSNQSVNIGTCTRKR